MQSLLSVLPRALGGRVTGQVTRLYRMVVVFWGEATAAQKESLSREGWGSRETRGKAEGGGCVWQATAGRLPCRTGQWRPHGHPKAPGTLSCPTVGSDLKAEFRALRESWRWKSFLVRWCF